MKYSVTIALLLTSFSVTLGTAASAHAQCYGESAQAFGCGVDAGSSGDLQRFGASDTNAILPDYGAEDGFSPDALFSDQERKKMYRKLIVKPSSSSGADSALQRSMNASSRPLRMQKSVASRFNRRYRNGGRAW